MLIIFPYRLSLNHLDQGKLDERGACTDRVAMANPADVVVALTQVW